MLNHEIEVDFLEHFLIQFLRILELDICHVGAVLTMIDERKKVNKLGANITYFMFLLKNRIVSNRPKLSKKYVIGGKFSWVNASQNLNS